MTAYQKRKLEIEELKKEVFKLRGDLRKIVIDKNFGTELYWSAMFNFEDQQERMIWAGNSSFTIPTYKP